MYCVFHFYDTFKAVNCYQDNLWFTPGHLVPEHDIIHADLLLMFQKTTLYMLMCYWLQGWKSKTVRNQKKKILNARLIMWSLSCYMKSIESLEVVLNMQGAWNSSNTAFTMVQGQAYCIKTWHAKAPTPGWKILPVIKMF